MAQGKLQEFFREKKSKADPGDVDWEAKRDQWIRAVEKLYQQIEKFLAKSIKEKTVAVSRRPKQFAEDFIGGYTIDDLVLQVGDESVVFSPKGTLIVGASGRVDVRGDMGDVTLVRQPGDRWSVVAARTPALKLIPLNEDSLLTALEKVMRP